MQSEEQMRLERLALAQQGGNAPFPAGVPKTHSCAQAQSIAASDDTTTVMSVAGRIMGNRQFGGLTFVKLRDESGTFQVALHKDVLGEELYNRFQEITDLGDFFSFTGTGFKTKKGEPSLDVTSYKLAAKSLLPPPEKWHGLTDTEKRYRQRYIDLASNEESFRIAKLRSQIVGEMRDFLKEEGFLEVDTPMLQAIPGGTTAKPFITHHDALDHDFYLRIAPELFLKRLLVGGFEKIYEYARCFRNEGISPQHNPEFTQIELYWAYATIDDLIDHLKRLIARVVSVLPSPVVTFGEHELDFSKTATATFHDLVLEHAGIDVDQASDEASLLEAMAQKGIPSEGCIGYADLLDTLYKHSVRPRIIQPTFVVDYPAAMKPLAKRREDNPHYSAGAQLVVAGIEVWNAFNELNDPREQRERFEEQEALRERGSEEAQWLDEDYLTALSHGMPPAAGYGLGIDRFIMLLTGSSNLKEVILFPTLKPLADKSSSDKSE